jgi:hypothetical protein
MVGAVDITPFVRATEFQITPTEPAAVHCRSNIRYPERNVLVPIGVAKSAYHHLSQSEIGGDNPCSRQLSESLCPVTAIIRPERFRVRRDPGQFSYATLIADANTTLILTVREPGDKVRWAFRI